MSEDIIQGKVNELRALENSINEINSRQSIISRAMLDSNASIEAIKTLSENEKQDTLMPIGGGVYLDTNLSKPSSLVVNIGSNVAVQKSVEDTIQYLESRSKELEQAGISLEGQKIELINRINSIRNEVNSLVAGQQPG